MKSSCLISYILSFLFFFFLNQTAFSETTVKADPDFISSGLSGTTAGIPSIKIGDVIFFRYFLIGGMFEARNEARFDQEILPNHNWRGIGRIEFSLFKRPISSSQLSVRAYLSHESAHPTMGIREPSKKSFELIYDDVYRRMILNSMSISGNITDSGSKTIFLAQANYHFYFLSKNTPELAGSKLGFSNGFSLGVEILYLVGRKTSCYVSIYDRLILQGNATNKGYIHKGNDDFLESTLVTYPIITETNTVVFKTGVSIPFNESRRAFDIYLRLLYGGIYGFVDSRDNRLMTSLGIEVFL